MSRSSPIPKLPAKRVLRSDGLDNQCSPSKFKIRKVSSVRHFPPNCGRLTRSKNMLNISQTKTEDVAALAATPLRTVNPNNMIETETSNERKVNDDVEKSVASDTGDCVCLPEEMWNCKLGKKGEITAHLRNLLDLFENSASRKNLKQVPVLEPESLMEKEEIKEKRAGDDILADSVPGQDFKKNSTEKANSDDKILFKLVVEKRDSGFRINLEDDDGAITILSPVKWKALQLRSKCYNDEVKATREKTKNVPENQSEQKNVVKSEGIENADFVDLDSFDDAKSDPQIEEDSDCEIIEIASPRKLEQDESVEKFKKDDNPVIVESSLNHESKCSQNRDLINLIIVERDHPEAIKAREVLEQFEEYYTELLHKPENMKGKGTSQTINEAASRLKVEGKWISTQKPFGHIPGVEIGDKFRFRAELAIVGLHYQMIAGIDYVKLDGKVFATSVVNSGRYENEAKPGNVLIYVGQGGNSKIFHADKSLDQKLEKGNLALANSMEMGYPVRVTFKMKRMKSDTVGMRRDSYDYVYDGLYTVDRYWEDRANNRKMVYKFELHRIPKQPRTREIVGSSRISMKCKEVCVLDDISDGLERVKIRVMNGVDDDRPLPFTYMTKMVYPDFFVPVKPVGCDCVNGCSDFHPCSCVKMNGGEIPFNEEGSIIMSKPVVHECGPQCKCPPTCMNRVSQLGLKYHLEIFKTKSMGWGVRSRNYISSGSFICEYVGDLLRDNEADERICSDEYLFDIYNDDANGDGFAIDGLKNGNIGRFLNHSCSPNLYAQEVLYDHDDTRIPHIMFFATKHIPPLKELTYDYNYQLDHVCVNGKVKTKDCHCGSRECTGRMY